MSSISAGLYKVMGMPSVQGNAHLPCLERSGESRHVRLYRCNYCKRLRYEKAVDKTLWILSIANGSAALEGQGVGPLVVQRVFPTILSRVLSLTDRQLWME